MTQPKQPEPEKSLRALGERLRVAFDALQPAEAIRLAQLRDFVRDEWHREQEARQKSPAPGSTTKDGRTREISEPERE